MRSEIVKMNQSYFKQVKNNFNLDDLESVELNRMALIKYTKRKLHKWIFMEYYNYFETINLQETVMNIERFIENGDPIFVNDQTVPIEISFFHHVLVKELSYVTITKDSPKNFRVIIDAFNDFLTEVKINFNKIDLVNSEFKHFQLESAVVNKLLNQLIKELIDIEELNFGINQLFDIADRSYLMTLLSFDNLHYSKNQQINESRFFDFEKYLNPIELKEFPKESLMFNRALKTVLNLQLEYRKRTLVWDNFPVEYQYIYDYAEKFTPVPVNNPTPALAAPKQSQDSVREEYNYPKHIFLNKNAFLLFETINKNMTSHVQLSFLYRIMAEKDQLIVVKDTPFREWYNKQNYQLQLDYTTKTLKQAKTDDRMALYAIIKELIINN